LGRVFERAAMSELVASTAAPALLHDKKPINAR
jgi:hypothetical protein